MYGHAPPQQFNQYQQAHNPYGQPAGHQTYTYPAYNPSMRPQAGPPPGVDMALWQWFQVGLTGLDCYISEVLLAHTQLCNLVCEQFKTNRAIQYTSINKLSSYLKFSFILTLNKLRYVSQMAISMYCFFRLWIKTIQEVYQQMSFKEHY